jgi:hypothetical protein
MMVTGGGNLKMGQELDGRFGGGCGRICGVDFNVAQTRDPRRRTVALNCGIEDSGGCQNCSVVSSTGRL